MASRVKCFDETPTFGCKLAEQSAWECVKVLFTHVHYVFSQKATKNTRVSDYGADLLQRYSNQRSHMVVCVFTIVMLFVGAHCGELLKRRRTVSVTANQFM